MTRAASYPGFAQLLRENMASTSMLRSREPRLLVPALTGRQAPPHLKSPGEGEWYVSCSYPLRALIERRTPNALAGRVGVLASRPIVSDARGAVVRRVEEILPNG